MLTTFFQEEHEQFRKSVCQYLEKEVAPHVEEWEKAELFPREVFRRCGELGFLGRIIPKTWAGRGAIGGTRRRGASRWCGAVARVWRWR